MARLIDESERSGSHIATETMRPSAGAALQEFRDGVTTTDGPFTESKELIAGYVIVAAESLRTPAAGPRATSTRWKPTR
jgi:hypothetical protein